MNNNFNSFDQDDQTAMFNPADIQQNKGISYVAYVPLLFLIPLFAASNSPYAKFHANQGIIFTLFSFLLGIVFSILGFVLGFIPILGTIVGILLWAIEVIAVIGLLVIGMLNVSQGKAKRLPIIGGLATFVK